MSVSENSCPTIRVAGVAEFLFFSLLCALRDFLSSAFSVRGAVNCFFFDSFGLDLSRKADPYCFLLVRTGCVFGNSLAISATSGEHSVWPHPLTLTKPVMS